ncbi:hypothetical protein RQP46_010206 [Phenoliferia psychrophenolica]
MLFASSIIALAAVASVHAHGNLASIKGANGAVANGLAIVPGTPGTGSTKVTEVDTTIFGAKANRNAAALTGCGKTPGGGVTDCATAAAQSLATAGGTVPTANADGTVDLTFHQVNQDGAGPLAAMVSTDMGKTWLAATVQENAGGTFGLSGASNKDIPVRVQVPAGTSCSGTAGTATGVCLVALANPIAGFGGAAPFAMANAATPAAAPAAAAPAMEKPLLVSEGVDPADFQIKAFLHKRHMRDFHLEIVSVSLSFVSVDCTDRADGGDQRSALGRTARMSATKPNGPPNERSSLLPAFAGGNGATDENGDESSSTPTTMASLKALILSGYLNVLLVAVPLSFLSHFLKWGSTADFIISFVAIIPLASLLGDATEQCSLKLGQTIGDAVELIVGILALFRGELRIVQTSMLGSILSNSLLVLGSSFIAAGFKFKESSFQQTAAQDNASLMMLSCATVIIPAAYHATRVGNAGVDVFGEERETPLQGLLTISRGTAVIALGCYIAYLYFQLVTHAYLFKDPEEDEEEQAKMNLPTAITSLVVITVITSFCADYLVGAIEEFSNDFGVPKAFIGLILLPIVGNAAEHVTSVWMAMKGKMELTIGVSVGSSIQISIGLIPILVIVGWIIDQDLTLFFENFETAVFLISVLLVNLLVQDGKSNWLEGVMLVALYFIIALATWVS